MEFHLPVIAVRPLASDHAFDEAGELHHIAPEGESQYSTSSIVTLSKASSGSFRPLGNHALYRGFQSSSAFLRSLSRLPVPLTETKVLPSGFA